MASDDAIDCLHHQVAKATLLIQTLMSTDGD